VHPSILTMRFAAIFLSAISLLTGAVSSFGLPCAKKAILKEVIPFLPRGGSAVKPSPLVQPVDITGKRLAVSLNSASADAISTSGGATSVLKGLDVPLLIYFALWYLGNYYYNISNKLALKAAGGVSGFPMTISALQLGIGCLYGIFLWLAPDARQAPTVTVDDIVRMLPVAFCAMGAHCASVFALSAGAVSFGQIVKAAEP